MSRLYPPYIEGKIRAQSGTTLYIPFRLNSAVSKTDFNVITLKLKTVSSNIEKGTYTTKTFANNEAIFTNIDGLKPGQYYKAQLAFGCSADNNLGYYSSIGVFKYTNTILSGNSGNSCIYIDDMNDYHKHKYVGIYRHEDIPEKAYSYCFNIYENDKIVLTSGTQIHNNENDVATNESYDSWFINQQLELGKSYSVQYIVNTVNGLPCESLKYPIRMKDLDNDDALNSLHMSLQMEKDFENGCIKLHFYPNSNTVVFSPGEYIISRASSKDNFVLWQDIHRFNINTTNAMPKDLFIDFTVEQGVTYAYALQQYGDSQISDRIQFISNQNNVWEDYILADFEDMFLYDGIRQFKIRFNPKISSFKATILETKTDTIGGKYPFIFRNGDVRYREMNISGLVSHLSDNDEFFLRKRDLGYATTSATGNGGPDTSAYDMYSGINLTATNFMAEREFKHFVLSWLTDGKPKLLRTPAEGNFIVRLMNTSMSPNDTLSRMLHTFTSTAYEIAEYNIDNLIAFNIIENCTSDMYEVARIKYYPTFISGAKYIELLDSQDYVLTYDNGITEIVSGPLTLLAFNNLFTNVSPSGNVISGIIENNINPIAYTPITGTTESRSVVVDGYCFDIIKREESKTDSYRRINIENWDTITFANRLSTYIAAWRPALNKYQYCNGADENGEALWHDLENGQLYQVNDIYSSVWVEKNGNVLSKFENLENFVIIKEHDKPQRIIYVTKNNPVRLNNINIDYLYVGRGIKTSGTYNYIGIS